MEQTSATQYFGFPQKPVRTKKRPKNFIQWAILAAILGLAAFEIYWFVFRSEEDGYQPTQVVTFLE